jgi:hypothetical protein
MSAVRCLFLVRVDNKSENMVSPPKAKILSQDGKSQRRICNMNEEVRSEEVQETYQSPKVVEIGKAVDLLQGATGKHTDGSIGYYWDQKG